MSGYLNRPALGQFMGVDMAISRMAAFGSVLSGAVSACAFQANVSPTAAPAAEIMPNRTIDAPASMYVAPELASLSQNAAVGYTCSAHTFPINAGPAIVSTARTVNEGTFSALVPGGTLSEPGEGATYHVVFDYEEFNPRVDFVAEYFNARAIAEVEIVMSATLLDASGNRILRTLISGEGNSNQTTGGCEAGADALAEATTEAIGRAFENYVLRVVNSDQIRALDGATGETS